MQIASSALGAVHPDAPEKQPWSREVIIEEQGPGMQVSGWKLQTLQLSQPSIKVTGG